MKRILVAAVGPLVMLGLVACGPGESESPDSAAPDSPTVEQIEAPRDAADAQQDAPMEDGAVSRDQLGDEWPFTVDSGMVACDGANGVGEVTFTAEGTTYAVNGLAIQTGQYAEIDTIWADDPTIPGAKKSIGPIIDLGLALCE